MRRILMYVLLTLLLFARPGDPHVNAQESCDQPGGGDGGGGCLPSENPPSTNCTWDPVTCNWVGCDDTPVIVDLDGDGFDLTDANHGVDFDLDGNGIKTRFSWTSEDSDDAWLTLDRNGNGVVDNGIELFGNYTPQPAPPPDTERNGFLALAVYDANGDGTIDSQDPIFTNLRLWQDHDHNGISEAEELHTLAELKILAIDIDYRLSKKTDRYGNRFRYKARVHDARGANVGHWAYDVFLLR